MELEIKKIVETPLLSRKRVTGWVTAKGVTPSRKNVQKEVAKKSNVKEELVIIKHVYTRYGQQNSKVIAHIYSNTDDLKKFEKAYMIKKHEVKAEEKSAE